MHALSLYYAFLTGVGLERLAELRVARRNAAWSRERHGVEYGRRQYPLMVVLHIGLLAGCVLEPVAFARPFIPWLGWPALAVALGCQVVRWWCVATLGPRWNTRVIVVPGLSGVTAGPYRWLKHPNYVAVALEGMALPLVHTAWLTAVCFTIPDTALLLWRIRTEEAALGRTREPAPVVRSLHDQQVGTGRRSA